METSYGTPLASYITCMPAELALANGENLAAGSAAWIGTGETWHNESKRKALALLPSPRTVQEAQRFKDTYYL